MQSPSPDADKTILPASITNQAWDLMMPGDGIDVVTGFRMPSAFDSFEINPEPTFTSDYAFYMIKDEDTYSRSVSAEAGMNYNMGAIHASANAAFLLASKFSSTSISILIRAVYETSVPGKATYKLSVDAIDLARTDPFSFREVYGDYVVASAFHGARLYAVYNCTCSSKESLMEFSTAMGGGSDLFEVSGATAFKQAAKAHNVETRISWFIEGVGGPPDTESISSDPDGMVALHNWFLNEVKGDNDMVPLRAKLVHCSQYFGPDIPHILDISSDTFLTINRVRTQLANLLSVINDLPQYYIDLNLHDLDPTDFPADSGSVGEYIRLLFTTFKAIAPNLPKNPNFLAQISDAADGLDEILKKITPVVDFYRALMTAPPPESLGGKTTVVFGFAEDFVKYVPVPVTSSEYSIKVENGALGHFPTWAQFPFDFNPLDCQIIVGWKLESLKTNNGQWSSGDARPIIGSASCFINFVSQNAHDLDWKMTVWSVASTSFPWINGVRQSGSETTASRSEDIAFALSQLSAKGE